MTSLIQYERARAALMEATSADEVLPLLDEIAIAKRIARQINDKELLAKATVLQMRGERQLGFIIEAGKKAGHFKEGRPKKNGTVNGAPLPPATLDDIGVSKKLSSRAQKQASITEQVFEMMERQVAERFASDVAVPVNGARAMAPGRKEPSASLDFSPTPPFATRALCEDVFEHLFRNGAMIKPLATAWEPACGEGHMAEVLREEFASVVATDIFDYGYGDVQDFLDPEFVPATKPDWIITNPPFREKAEQFALLALERAKVGVAIFARLQWLETIGRYERLFRDQPPTLIAFFCERVNLCMGRWEPEGGTATAYIWLVWVKGMEPQAPFWIPPGRQKELSHVDDAVRFTAHPVIKKADYVPHDAETGEVIEEHS